MKIKFRAKCLFRALGRMVMANAYWLIEGVDHYEGFDDVKRRVEQAVRGKAKKKQLLTIKDKALLNKNAEERTDKEKSYIYRIIGGLKCFKRYPNHVKRKLAAVTYYKYYGPGRVIVRQHHEAHALYFVISGDVVVSQLVFDELIQQFVSVEIGVIHSGDMFGEVSLLHNIPRTATVTTTGHCELLVLMKEDFKNVLQASIQKQWDEVRFAMSAFTYFDALDEVALREGCIVAKMKTYAINETVLGDGVGVQNFVYFILSGRCQMIESIQVIATKRLRKTHYSLYDPYVANEEESEQDLDTKYFRAYTKISKDERDSAVTVGSTRKVQSPSLTKPDNSLKDVQRSENASETEKPRKESADLQSIAQLKSEETSKQFRASIRLVIISNIPEVGGDVKPKENLKTYFMQYDSAVTVGSTRKVQSPSLTKPDNSLKDVQRSENASETEKPRKESADLQSIAQLKSEETSKQFRASIRISNIPEVGGDVKPKENLKTYFMQVCQFNPGSTFGFGENLRDRRIVALTPVSCMLLPKIWLLQRNTANIWTRIQHYLEKKIPKKKQLFKQFVSARRWEEFRDNLVEDVMSRTNGVNWTSAHDVPYSIRMEEMLDI
ncbi:uncharacterized protein LOC112056669 [Bicyclus anynana]|uniref:Uncharacterized protein LOC112056669 n=1 Tax=Bicyclus anynana TaxID=110368 RepID=A0ABM3LGF7_BICAN|nr:uncharacterized protein LOC112056669 [Bicyclus anynana]